MIDINELREMNQFAHLDDGMLEKILRITSTREFRAGENIYKDGEYADCLYSVLEGKVGKDIQKDSSTMVTIEHLERGRTLGLSALLNPEQKTRTSNAKAITDTKLLVWKAEDLEKLFTEDYKLGFLFMKRIASIIKRNLVNKNAQMIASYK